MPTHNDIWHVRVDLSAMSRELALLDNDKARAQWLIGFHQGALGAEPGGRWTAQREAGWRFGASSRGEAQAFRNQKIEAGQRSVAARKMRLGSAQPLRTPFEHRSNESPNGTSNETPNEPSNERPNEPSNQ